jgi:hypothetical protein
MMGVRRIATMTWQHQREIVFTWFDRGEQERETFHGFICGWIALNAALSARYAVRGDRAKVLLLADELEPLWRGWLVEDAALREAATELADASPIYDEPRSDGPPSQAAVSADSATSVLMGVYAVRNNLFHGSKRFGDLRDHRLVKVANQIVRRVLINSGLVELARRGRSLEEPLAPAGPAQAAR